MTEIDRWLIRICANTSIQLYSGVGNIRLHPLTKKQIVGLRLIDMLMEEPKVWGEDGD